MVVFEIAICVKYVQYLMQKTGKIIFCKMYSLYKHSQNDYKNKSPTKGILLLSNSWNVVKFWTNESLNGGRKVLSSNRKTPHFGLSLQTADFYSEMSQSYKALHEAIIRITIQIVNTLMFLGVIM